jgi:hypothetical protein
VASANGSAEDSEAKEGGCREAHFSALKKFLHTII